MMWGFSHLTFFLLTVMAAWPPSTNTRGWRQWTGSATYGRANPRHRQAPRSPNSPDGRITNHGHAKQARRGLRPSSSRWAPPIASIASNEKVAHLVACHMERAVPTLKSVRRLANISARPTQGSDGAHDGRLHGTEDYPGPGARPHPESEATGRGDGAGDPVPKTEHTREGTSSPTFLGAVTLFP